MTQAPQDNHTPDEPRISANHWYALAVSAAILTGAGFVIAYIWVFWSNDPHPINERAQALAPFGAAAIAVVTFFTIAWRGVQTDHQLRQQAAQVRFQGDQLAQIVRQNDAKEEENLVKVLQEGAKLIAEPEKQSQVLAGISSLEYLVMKKTEPFSVQAANLLANLLMQIYNPDKNNLLTRAVFSSLQKCEDNNINTTVEGNFSFYPEDEDDEGRWSYIPAIRSVKFTGGMIKGDVLSRMSKRIDRLVDVQIHEAIVDYSNIKYTRCKFIECKIVKTELRRLYIDDFQACDFSDANVKTFRLTNNDAKTIKNNANFYTVGHPPRNQSGISIAEYFLTEDEYLKHPDRIPF